MIDSNDDDELGINDLPAPAASLAPASAQDDQPSAQRQAPKKLKSTPPRINPLPASKPSATTVVAQTTSPAPQYFNDGSIPLSNPRFERMVQFKLNGALQAQAYKATSKAKVSKASAEAASSRIFARDDVQRRLAYLTIAPKSAPKVPEKAKSDKPLSSDYQVEGGIVSRDAILRALSQAISKGTTSDIVQASKALLSAMPDVEDKDASPDPAIFTAWLASIAGTPGPDIVREIGGPRFVIDRICAALNISRDDLKSMI